MRLNPLLGALVGAVFTVVIQSSSATVAIVITLAGSNMTSLPAGIAIMLGAEIGTCADTLVATIGRGRAALRTGIFHLLFNVGSGPPALEDGSRQRRAEPLLVSRLRLKKRDRRSARPPHAFEWRGPSNFSSRFASRGRCSP
jgi:hypothetical protein